MGLVSLNFATMGVAAIFAMSGLAGWQGYRAGYAAAEHTHNAALLTQIEAAKELDLARRALAVERDTLARQLEEESHASPVLVDRCLAPERVRRLNAIN